MQNGRNRDHIFLLEYSVMMPVSKKKEMTSFPYMEVMSHRRVAQSYISAFNHYTFLFFQIELLRNLREFYSIHLEE